MRHMKTIVFLVMAVAASGCSTVGQILNPFYDTPSEVAYRGEKNDRALNEGGANNEKARAAFTAMGDYQRALPPQPNNPVLQPAVVRLMWVPDHLNSHGDLVPAHYYYVKVLRDRFAVTDAFELQGQIGDNTGATSGMGYALPEDLQ